MASVRVEFDFQQYESDPCIFIHKNKDGNVRSLLYVDNLLIDGDNEEDIATIKRRLSDRFELGSESSNNAIGALGLTTGTMDAVTLGNILRRIINLAEGSDLLKEYDNVR